MPLRAATACRDMRALAPGQKGSTRPATVARSAAQKVGLRSGPTCLHAGGPVYRAAPSKLASAGVVYGPLWPVHLHFATWP